MQGPSLAGDRLRRVLRAPPLWLGGWLRDRFTKAILPRPKGRRHLLFAVCDHFEPLHGGASLEVGVARALAWLSEYPKLANRFADAGGRPPRHTFFFPGEQYDPVLLEPLAELVQAGLGEVEVHLHHDRDTRETLRGALKLTLDALATHGLVPRRGGALAWSFIHGNWALANGRPDGRWCGVDDELAVLRELGCYADFTFPSAPDPCQPRIVNSIYYPRRENVRRSYDDAERVRVGTIRHDRVLLVQGPLAIAWRGSGSHAPRIDAGALHASDPPSRARLETWIDQWVHIDGRPEWTFVKLYAHGAPEKNAQVMLGEAMQGLHHQLAELKQQNWDVHYVTAREMYNVARAAMDGKGGSPAAYFDYEVPRPERAMA